MTNLIAAFLAITLYLGCTILLMMKLRGSGTVATLSKQMILVPGFLGLGAHLYTLSMSMMSPIGINIGCKNVELSENQTGDQEKYLFHDGRSLWISK